MQDVAPPSATAGQVVVDVERVGVCGTDVEFFTGEMPYLHDGQAEFPIRLGHEWCGVVVEVGDGVDDRWLGRRVTGDTMLGCGACRRCRRGSSTSVSSASKSGSGAASPARWPSGCPCRCAALHELPDTVDADLGALVEPGGNALRSVWVPGLIRRAIVFSFSDPGTIGLLVALPARAQGAEARSPGPARIAHSSTPGPWASRASGRPRAFRTTRSTP